MKSLWSRIGGVVGRPWLALGITVLAGGLLVLQGLFLRDRMRIKVEASDLLPADHPKNKEFEFIRHTFKGSSRGFYVAVEAEPTRLRAVVPEVARALQALPEIDFIRWRVEREYFEDNFLLFQSLPHLKQQAAYLAEYKRDVARLAGHGGSLAEFLTALADIIDGEQELSAPTNETAKDAKLATDVDSLAPFLTMLATTFARGGAVDPRFVDRGLEDLLLRGWFDAKDVSRLDRELYAPETLWQKAGPTLALVWVATQRSDFDPDFSAAFMKQAESIRAELRARFPDVGFHFTGGIASYNTYSQTVRHDFARANVLGLIAVLLLLVVGFRAIAPFLLLMLFLFEGTAGTLVMQNLLFSGVNMIATAASMAVIGIGSDYGVIFLLAYQKEMADATRERDRSGRMTRKQWLRAVRRAIKSALGTIGVSTTTGCIISAASFLALTGSDIVPLAQRLVGLHPSISKSFQPIRELGVGGAVGLLYCLILMLIALPSSLYLVEWVKTHPVVEKLGALGRPLSRRLRRSKRWLIWSGRAHMVLRTDHERRWFRALANYAIRHRVAIVVASIVLFVGAVVASSNVQWSTGQKEVEPRHSEAIEVSERVERTFGKSFENVLVYGPLDLIRRFHKKVEKLEDRADSNVGEVLSIDDYLPAADEPQADKLAAAQDIDAALAQIRPALPATDLVFDAAEAWRVTAALGRAAAALEGVHADPATLAALAGVRADIGALALALAAARPLEPAAEWREDWGRIDAAALGLLRDACRATADRWLESQVAQARITELKRIAGEVDALARFGGGAIARRDLAALRLALAQLGASELVLGFGLGAAPAAGTPLWVARAGVLGPARRLARRVADSSVLALKVKEGDVLAAAMAELEAATDVIALRARPAADEAGAAVDRVAAAALRLRHSLDSLASFAAASGYASVAPRMPATTAALDGVIAAIAALPEDRGEGVARDVDNLFAERIFDRFEAMRHAARVRRPLAIADVPDSARRIFSGVDADGQVLYLARVLPRLSMLERRPFQETRDSVEATLRDVSAGNVHSGYSGFEVLLNLATDYLEGTFTGAMVTVSIFVLLALYLLHRSALATFIVAAPVILGTVMTLAFMALTHMRITIFTVVAIPIVIGVAMDSSIQVFRVYWDEVTERGQASLPEVMAEVGKVVSLNALSTVLPFGVMMLGDMKGLVALGTVLAFGCLSCYVAKLVLLPCLMSIVHDLFIPGVQYAHMLLPRLRTVRALRAVAGRWEEGLPRQDPGLEGEVQADGVLVVTVRRPPLNLIDAAMCSRWTEVARNFTHDPELRVAVMRSGLPEHYLIEDATGKTVVDGRGKPKKIAASVAENDALPRGYRLLGPMRTFGAGADLAAMSQNTLNALFTLRGSIEISCELWYARKPMVFLCEGDAVAGTFETAMYFNLFLVTKHARLGAPEVKRGLTLPFGAHALQFRGGTAVAGHLMATGELIGGEEAVKLGIADALIPDGVDPLSYAVELASSREYQDRCQQTSILRQYGPPMRKLLNQSISNYIRMLRDPETRRRIRSFLRDDE
jgi:predicted RND superfamily exporter protein/enoyl-CoA hydratase/carnithine racemase